MPASIEELLHGELTVLVVTAGPGMGKTTLLEKTASRSPDRVVVRLAGVRGETDLPYAALHRLLVPALADLPETLRRALDGDPEADRLAVGLAAFELLRRAARDKPLLLCVDDAHWLDEPSLQTLAFVARRLHRDEAIALITARTEPAALRGLPTYDLPGLRPDQAATLLGRRLDAPIVEQAVRATGGNPQALLDLADHLPASGPIPLGPALQRHYAAQVAGLPEATRQWLLVAAAEPEGDYAAIEAAAVALGLGHDASLPAETAGIVRIGATAGFEQPLVRSAVYAAATRGERRQAHLALADAISTESTNAEAAALGAGRRAWHRACATTGTDETVAAALESAAPRNPHLLERAALLSPDPRRRAARLLRAAESAVTAGLPLRAQELLARIDLAMCDETARQRSRMVLGLALAAAGEAGAVARAAALSLSAAAAMPRESAGKAMLRALEQTVIAGTLLRDTTTDEVAAAALRLVGEQPRDTRELLVRGLARLLTGGLERAAADLRPAVRALTTSACDDDQVLSLSGAGSLAADLLGDERAYGTLLHKAARSARALGAAPALVRIQATLAVHEAGMGNLDAARSLLAEADGDPALGPATAVLLAWAGDDKELAAVEARAAREAYETGAGFHTTITFHARVIAALGQGDYEQAYQASVRQRRELDALNASAVALPDLIEAAVRSGRDAAARAALAELRRHAAIVGGRRQDALLARAEALLAEVQAAENWYRAAVELACSPALAGRARLLYGEWLRRRNRRVDARAQLAEALEIFEQLGLRSFAGRARQELRATGQQTSAYGNWEKPALTPQEHSVARLASVGATNVEIATQLFISASTVDYHLGKVYRKLGVNSRRALRNHAELQEQT